jgi:hypothetical protein
MWQPEEVSDFVHVRANSDVRRFPRAPTFIAVITDIFGIRRCAVIKRWNNVLDAYGVAVKKMRAENGQLEFVITTT